MNGYWIDDYSNFRPKSLKNGHWGVGQTGFNVSASGMVKLTDNRPVRTGGVLHYPDHRDLVVGSGDNRTLYSGIYSFGFPDSPILWLYPAAEEAICKHPQMRLGLASLIGVHKITPDTPIKSNSERGTLFTLAEAIKGDEDARKMRYNRIR